MRASGFLRERFLQLLERRGPEDRKFSPQLAALLSRLGAARLSRQRVRQVAGNQVSRLDLQI